MVIQYTVYIHNHTPKQHNGLSLMEHWTKCISTHSQFINAHPWGVLLYILNTRLQNGFKISRFDPKAYQGIFTGNSPIHASTVGMILNPRTYRLSPQYHIIYDDYFETVPHDTENPPPNWKEFCIDNFQKIDIALDNENNDYFENG